MAEQDKHPSWFKLKIERRELLRTLPPEAAVKVVVACLDYLETMEQPKDLSELEKIGLAAFQSDLEEAWAKYQQRINARKSKDNGIGRNRTKSNDTEVETEVETEGEVEEETEERSKKKIIKADKPPRPRFAPPSVDEVKAYCAEAGYTIDSERFVDYYTANGWRVGKNPMKDWKAAVRTWNKKDKEKTNGRQGKSGESAVSQYGKIGTRL